MAVRPPHFIRAFSVFILWMTVFGLDGATTNQVLTAPQYSAAEAVYRSFFPGPQWREPLTNLVYCLSFGAADSPLPSDFMARFQSASVRVTTGTDGFVSGPGTRIERATGRRVIIITLSSLSIQGNHAEARVRYIKPSTVITETLQLTLKNEGWKLTKRKRESTAAF